jgi:molybdopterin-guanine dinucleotide biosynthesis protein A
LTDDQGSVGYRRAVFDAMVLAGGNASRLDAADKPGLDIGGLSLLRRVVTAARGAQRVIVVGPSRSDVDGVVWCREDPPGGGPVAAIATGLGAVVSDVVLVLAVDLPWIRGAVAPLLDALTGHDAAVLVDADGRRNHLAAAWRVDALRRALSTIPEQVNASVRSLFATGVSTVEVADPAGWGADCDTWDDVTRARERAAADGSTA